MVASHPLARDVAEKSPEPIRAAKPVAGMIVAAMLLCLGGCTNGTTNTKASATAPAPGSAVVHMNGEAGYFAGASSP